jgi:hypothetical protein
MVAPEETLHYFQSLTWNLDVPQGASVGLRTLFLRRLDPGPRFRTWIGDDSL